VAPFDRGTADASRLLDSDDVFDPGLEEKWVRLASRKEGVDEIFNIRDADCNGGEGPRDGRALVGVKTFLAEPPPSLGGD
jgi:hypothetical protein